MPAGQPYRGIELGLRLGLYRARAMARGLGLGLGLYRAGLAMHLARSDAAQAAFLDKAGVRGRLVGM